MWNDRGFASLSLVFCIYAFIVLADHYVSASYETDWSAQVRELGAFEKQSSMVFLAKTCAAHIHHNVFFNGPRAGVRCVWVCSAI